MTKAQLIAQLATLTPLTADQVRQVLDALPEVLIPALLAQAEAPLPGIGKLRLRRRAPRTGRNPRTGAAIAVSAYHTVTLSPSERLLKRLPA